MIIAHEDGDDDIAEGMEGLQYEVVESDVESNNGSGQGSDKESEAEEVVPDLDDSNAPMEEVTGATAKVSDLVIAKPSDNTEMDVARAREILIEDSRQKGDELILRRLLNMRDRNKDQERAAATEQSTFLRKRAKDSIRLQLRGRVLANNSSH